METVNPLMVPLAVTTIFGSTTAATLLLIVLAVDDPVMPNAVDGAATVMVATALVADAQAPLVTTAL